MLELPLPGGSAFQEEEWEHWEARYHGEAVCPQCLSLPGSSSAEGEELGSARLTPCSEERGTGYPTRDSRRKNLLCAFCSFNSGRCSGLLGVLLGVRG